MHETIRDWHARPVVVFVTAARSASAALAVTSSVCCVWSVVLVLCVLHFEQCVCRLPLPIIAAGLRSGWHAGSAAAGVGWRHAALAGRQASQCGW